MGTVRYYTILIMICFVAQQPKSSLGRLIVEVSMSQLDTYIHGRTPLNE
jgi:hypothetical protein